MSRNVFVLLSMYALIVIWFCVRVIISGFRRGANDIFDLLECNAALIGGYFRTFRDNLCPIFMGQAVKEEYIPLGLLGP